MQVVRNCSLELQEGAEDIRWDVVDSRDRLVHLVVCTPE